MIRAILFDLDGTLADTEPLHYAAFTEILRPDCVELSREEYFTRLIGYNDHDCFAAVLKENGRDASAAHIEALIARKAASYQEMLRNRDVLYPGATDFVRECAARFPLMIVTGTLRAEAEMILRRAGLRDLFVDIIAAEDVEHGNPRRKDSSRRWAAWVFCCDSAPQSAPPSRSSSRIPARESRLRGAPVCASSR